MSFTARVYIVSRLWGEGKFFLMVETSGGKKVIDNFESASYGIWVTSAKLIQYSLRSVQVEPITSIPPVCPVFFAT